MFASVVCCTYLMPHSFSMLKSHRPHVLFHCRENRHLKFCSLCNRHAFWKIHIYLLNFICMHKILKLFLVLSAWTLTDGVLDQALMSGLVCVD